MTRLRGAVFADAGLALGGQRHGGERAGPCRQHAGAARVDGRRLAWDSPLGNLRVDYAYPILKQPYDKTQGAELRLRPF
jgi:outer membrane protein insertion porin family